MAFHGRVEGGGEIGTLGATAGPFQQVVGDPGLVQVFWHPRMGQHRM